MQRREFKGGREGERGNVNGDPWFGDGGLAIGTSGLRHLAFVFSRAPSWRQSRLARRTDRRGRLHHRHLAFDLPKPVAAAKPPRQRTPRRLALVRAPARGAGFMECAGNAGVSARGGEPAGWKPAPQASGIRHLESCIRSPAPSSRADFPDSACAGLGLTGTGPETKKLPHVGGSGGRGFRWPGRLGSQESTDSLAFQRGVRYAVLESIEKT